ncbi:hypothetical protein [[Phormidium] sp. ETS-05]|uniref:hypothetical protein n=1 Tax=[Phormidium] sp. ETS-05 TaxID=222819 RepID=UPI0018EEF011|nr:hypothetical protein [[Phormidium] sp. ETS-05]
MSWDGTPSSQKKSPITADNVTYSRQDVAELSGCEYLKLPPGGLYPPAKIRAVLAEEISQICLENLIIFTDNQRDRVSGIGANGMARKPNPASISILNSNREIYSWAKLAP